MTEPHAHEWQRAEGHGLGRPGEPDPPRRTYTSARPLMAVRPCMGGHVHPRRALRSSTHRARRLLKVGGMRWCANQCPGRESLPSAIQMTGTAPKPSHNGGGAFLDIAGSFAHRWPERATLMLIEAGFVASWCLQAPHREHTRSTAQPPSPAPPAEDAL